MNPSLLALIRLPMSHSSMNHIFKWHFDCSWSTGIVLRQTQLICHFFDLVRLLIHTTAEKTSMWGHSKHYLYRVVVPPLFFSVCDLLFYPLVFHLFLVTNLQILFTHHAFVISLRENLQLSTTGFCHFQFCTNLDFEDHSFLPIRSHLILRSLLRL